MIFSSPASRKVIGELVQHRARTIMVILSITVGVIAVGAIAGAFFILPSDMSSGYAASNPPNIALATDPFDQDMLRIIAHLPAVDQVEGQKWLQTRIEVSPGVWRSLRLVAVDEPGKQEINRPLPLSGKEAPDKKELLISNQAADRLGASVDEVFTLELPNGATEEMRVAGIVMDLGGGLGAITGTNIAYVTRETLEWLGEADNFDHLLLTVSSLPDDDGNIHLVAQQVVDRLEQSGRQVYSLSEQRRSRHPLQNIITALLGILSLLGVLVLFLSGALITNTLSSLLSQQLRQVGIMKLVGGSRQQISSIYLWIVSVCALTALVFAIPLGGVSANAIVHLAADIINFPVDNPAMLRLSPEAVGIQIVVGLVVPILSALGPIKRGTGVSVRGALRSDGDLATAPSRSRVTRWFDRIVRLPRLLLLSLRNTFRKKKRLALTLGTLTLGGAVFIGVLNAQVALNQKVEGISRYFGADVNVEFRNLYHPRRVYRETLQVPGVESIEAWSSANAKLLDDHDNLVDSVALLAPPAESVLVRPVLLSGRWLRGDDKDALAINEAFLRRDPTLRPGSLVDLEINGKTSTWTVVGVFEFTGMDQLVAYTTHEHLSGVLDQHHRAAIYRIVTTHHSLEFQQAVVSRLEERFHSRGLDISDIEAGRSFIDSTTEYLSLLTAVLLAMALLTAAVGSIGLAGTLGMNVLERSREIGIMRAIGAHDGVIIKMVLAEGLIIGLLSFVGSGLLAMPISFALTQIISRAIFGSNAAFTLAFHSFAIWLALVKTLSTIASLLPAKNATHLTVREVLSYE